MKFYAHTRKDPKTKELLPKSEWEPLFTPFGEVDPEDPELACSGKNGASCPHCESLEPRHGHLNKVGYLASKFAAEMFPEGEEREVARQWGYLAGLWHDLGKYALEWKTYLETKADPHSDEVSEKMDHTTAGAKHAVSASPLGHLIATAIAGHHAGLLDTIAEPGASLEKRLKKRFAEDIPKCVPPSALLEIAFPSLPPFLTNLPRGRETNFSLAFFQRLIFSCLVDADFLATEAFMNPLMADQRPQHSSEMFSQALELLTAKIEKFGLPDPSDKVAVARATVVNDCTRSASEDSGIFTLTVPTGGGKTLSSLNFALRHALEHQKKRIIYVIPFTSIIEQNAAVFRELFAPLGDGVVIEHHSNLSAEEEEKQTETSRLATENWDAPIIVTTTVQFYESLYAAKTSRSRKIHHIANSVVVLDEAQSLPVDFLDPCLRVLRELSSQYHTTTVLCTATQPAVANSQDFPIGFPESIEIIQDTERLFSDLDRVEVTYRGKLVDQTIADELAAASQGLCIVNTRRHARVLFGLLPENPEENFHLSTLMCPRHRLQVLSTVRQRLKDNLPVRLISTQLIEAGVDVDFPIVYRSMAGLDSIAQAAGRCNREGKLKRGQVYVFHSEHSDSERFFAASADLGYEFLDLYSNDPLGVAAIQRYFNAYYYQNKSHWDAKDILGDFEFGGDPKLPFLFNYRTAAEKFRLIETNQIPIIIPWNDEAKWLCKDLCNETIPLHRKLLRKLQRYTVQIYENEFRANYSQFESLRDGTFYVLICPEIQYSVHYGLFFHEDVSNPLILL